MAKKICTQFAPLYEHKQFICVVGWLLQHLTSIHERAGRAARASTSLNSWHLYGRGALDARPPSAGSHEAAR